MHSNLCKDCKVEDKIAEQYLDIFDLSDDVIAYKGVGCSKCNFTGYTGRKAIAELFLINKEVQFALKGEVTDNQLEDIAINNGMITLQAQLREMIKEGRTSFDEAIRIGLH